MAASLIAGSMRGRVVPQRWPRAARLRIARWLAASKRAVAGRAVAPNFWSTLLEDGSPALLARNAAAAVCAYQQADTNERLAQLRMLNDHFDADAASVCTAVEAYRYAPDPDSVRALHAATEPRRHLILRRLALAPNGLETLIAMRADLQSFVGRDEAFDALDRDLRATFTTWFDGGFLVLRRLDWHASGRLLGRLIDGEAVHSIGSWTELQARLEPADRRCYALFHPQLPDDPLIFVEVALTRGTPCSIDALLALDRPVLPAEAADTAVFYSISNCQPGLRGIPLGGLLIKQTSEALLRDMPHLATRVTLSPIPSLRREVARAHAAGELPPALMDVLSPSGAATGEALLRLAARWLTGPAPQDPVARFHLGNGARLEHLWPDANRGARGQRESFGIMASYRYDARTLEANRARFRAEGAVAASPAVVALTREGRGRQGRVTAARQPLTSG